MKPFRITIHCTATPNGERRDVEVIRAFHKAPPPHGRGWSDIGYHSLIQPDGEVQPGRSLTEQGAHVSGANEGNLGICLVGTDRFSWRQLSALKSHVETLMMLYSIKPWEIRCHNQFPSAIAQKKACPSMEIGRLLYWIVTGDRDAVACYVRPE